MSIRINRKFAKTIYALALIIILSSSLYIKVYPAGPSLKVQMYNVETNASTDSIKIKFKLVNNGVSAINLLNMKLRYYYSVNGYIKQSFKCTNYSGGSTSSVTGTFIPLTTVSSTADCYLEIGFNKSDSLASGQNRELSITINKNINENYLQTDDYSYNPVSNYTDWNKSTAYISNSLVWGNEPVLTTVLPDHSIKLQMYNLDNGDRLISFNIKMINNGAKSIDLRDVKLEYYYTVDGEMYQLNLCYWYPSGNPLGIDMNLIKSPTKLNNVDYIAQIRFTALAGELVRGEQRELQCNFFKLTLGRYNTSNDYSYNNSDSYVDWDKITCSIDNTKTWGVDPYTASSSTSTPTPTGTSTPAASPTATNTPVIANALWHNDAMTSTDKFAVGDNIPASLAFKISRNLRSPIISLDMNLKNATTGLNSGFKLKTLGKSSIDKQHFKVYVNDNPNPVNPNDITTSEVSSDNGEVHKLRIQVNRGFTAGDIIKINYRVKLSATNTVYNYGLSKYIKDNDYSNNYLITDFELTEWTENGITKKIPYTKDSCPILEKPKFIMKIRAEDNLILY
ncbi:cellulose binding domain-containing protein [Pseudobacteroides cellulosolvens]|uniref:Type 3a cellulose-binding domain protein n=1 Tax=Pseudobacteroides cellulosolvens ATCC 35603 = DSM 2933 TaxID=398512 RepID=A0A0L6JUD1_9FIRM|nr:cellulose binding domain-containing protein [Pseudobacteroides cellulosolvens]KNY29255.1 type 3a cellulose-binding domain protein [Pseudobacteroides cellulosolvens ATCC 35603 = DSM 2933]